MAGEVVDLLYRDAKVQEPCDKGVAEIMGPDVAVGEIAEPRNGRLPLGAYVLTVPWWLTVPLSATISVSFAECVLIRPLPSSL